MPEIITDEIFKAFLKCETKSYLKIACADAPQNEFGDWQHQLSEDYKQQCSISLCSKFQRDRCLIGEPTPTQLAGSDYLLVIDSIVQAQGIQSRIHALERVSSPGTSTQGSYIPIRFVANEKISRDDKLLLAFDALVLSTAFGKTPLYGKIIHGREQKAIRVLLAGLMKAVRSTISKLTTQRDTTISPQLILNRHCSECEFQAQCRRVAIEKDELSLLGSMSKKERKKYHNKGIFSVTQLSYTFRLRKKSKRLAAKSEKYHHSLKALAIREHKIHIVGKPALENDETPVYLDVEGIPDQNFYYLIGLRVKSGDSYVQHSFWANEPSEEKEMWNSFLHIIEQINHPHLIHYGSYETAFLRRMKQRYGGATENAILVDHLIAQAVNILSNIHAHIYFPTYSNGLKEIAQYLGFQWSESTASGLSSLRWRQKWELSKDDNLKQKLLTYNAQDCEALESLTNIVTQICQKQTRIAQSRDETIASVDLLKNEEALIGVMIANAHDVGQRSDYKFQKQVFSNPDLDYINKAAYFDYQKDKVFLRTNASLKRIRECEKRKAKAANRINKHITIETQQCLHCGNSRLHRQRYARSKDVIDLRFSSNGVKRWIVRYWTFKYKCPICSRSFVPAIYRNITQLYGHGLVSWCVYQYVVNRQSYEQIQKGLFDVFSISIPLMSLYDLKSDMAKSYQQTYENLLAKIARSNLIHADETDIKLQKEKGYIWVFTNREEAAFIYKPTREGHFLQELLNNFNGVLISDFYSAYDSIDCLQQKCLVHLIRDLNEDLLYNPFNEEFKEMVRDFTLLLRRVIATVDQYGLRRRYSKKYKPEIEKYFNQITNKKYQSELAEKYQKRFNKSSGKLFTFLDDDDVPWNNNYAEHTIKAFAHHRRSIEGRVSEIGIKDHLLLLSIYQTCRYKGVSFLEFLRSKENDIDVFLNKSNQDRKLNI